MDLDLRSVSIDICATHVRLIIVVLFKVLFVCTMPPKLTLLDASMCRKCNNVVKDAIFCPGCGASYHRSCAASLKVLPDNSYAKCCGSSPSTSPNDISMLSNDIRALTHHVTEGLDKINQTLAQYKTEIVDHGNRITSLEAGLLHVNTRLDNTDTQLSQHSCEYIFSEVERRLKSVHNIIFFNLPEPVVNGEYEPANDKESILKIYNILALSDLLFEDIKFFRLGIFSTSRPKPRPIKLQFGSPIQAAQFLAAARKVKTTLNAVPEFKNVVFSTDQTPLQQQHYRNFKATLLERVSQGETNLAIRRMKGTPTIVTIPTQMSETSQT